MIIQIAKKPFVIKSIIVIPMAIQKRIKPSIFFIRAPKLEILNKLYARLS